MIKNSYKPNASPLSSKAEIYLLHIIMGGFLLFLFIISYFSEGSLGGGDTWNHYYISRYAWKYPALFLDNWGKPVFTILASPFAQFGYNGIKLFNIIAGLLNSFFIYFLLKKRINHFAWLSFPILVFAPIQFVLMLSAMTEILFGTWILFSIYLYLKKKYLFSSIVLSFLPFVRNEGVLIMLVFGFVFLINKKFKYLPFFLLGYFLFSIAGYFILNDFFWVFSQNPYINNAADYFGRGSFFSYLHTIPSSWGLPHFFLFSVGLFSYLYDYLKNKPSRLQIISEFLLVFGSFFIFFIFHSYLWWKGIRILADVRYIACIIPLSAFIGVRFFTLPFFSRFNSFASIITVFILTIIFGITAFKTYNVPIQLNEQQVVIKEASDWLKSSGLDKNKIRYLHAFLPYALDKDRFDYDELQPFFDNINNEKPGTIIVWEPQHSVHEGFLELDSLLNNPNYQLLNVFRPVTPFKTWNIDFNVFIFQKTDSLNYNKKSFFTEKCFFYNFEEHDTLLKYSSIAFSGKKSMLLDSTRIYGKTIILTENDFPIKPFYWIKSDIRVYQKNEKQNNPIRLIISIEDRNNNNIRYKSEGLPENPSHNQWHILTNELIIKPDDLKNNVVKIYAYSSNSKLVIADDFSVTIHF